MYKHKPYSNLLRKWIMRAILPQKEEKMDFSKFQYAYAISGGIGSGKSSVCKILASLGYKVLDADKIAHKVLEYKTQEIVDVFGVGVLEREGINRKALGSIVFADREKLKILENILNPSIYAEIFERCQKLEEKKKPYFVEIALLFEQREMLNFKHKILIVGGNVVERIRTRDGLSEEQIRLRIQAQMSVEEKKKYASKVIENLSSLTELREKIEEWVRSL